MVIPFTFRPSINQSVLSILTQLAYFHCSDLWSCDCPI